MWKLILLYIVKAIWSIQALILKLLQLIYQWHSSQKNSHQIVNNIYMIYALYYIFFHWSSLSECRIVVLCDWQSNPFHRFHGGGSLSGRSVVLIMWMLALRVLPLLAIVADSILYSVTHVTCVNMVKATEMYITGVHVTTNDYYYLLWC